MKTFLALFILWPCWAWSQATVMPSVLDVESGSSLLDARFVYADYKYEEPGLMQIAGKLTGVSVDYRIPTFGSHFALIGAQYLGGVTYYDGTYQFSGEKTPTYQENDYNHTLKLAYGNRIRTAGGNFIDFSGGFARHFHKNNNDQYDREQVYLYLPLEVTMIFPVGTMSLIKFGIEQNIFLSGENKTKASQYDPQVNDRVYKQKSGSGSKLSLSYETLVLGRIILAQVYLQRWDIADSELVKATYKDGAAVTRNGQPMYYIEPENNTQTLGFSLGSRF